MLQAADSPEVKSQRSQHLNSVPVAPGLWPCEWKLQHLAVTCDGLQSSSKWHMIQWTYETHCGFQRHIWHLQGLTHDWKWDRKHFNVQIIQTKIKTSVFVGQIRPFHQQSTIKSQAFIDDCFCVLNISIRYLRPGSVIIQHRNYRTSYLLNQLQICIVKNLLASILLFGWYTYIFFCWIVPPSPPIPPRLSLALSPSSWCMAPPPVAPGMFTSFEAKTLTVSC